jgi:hypothetical protein
MASRYRGVRLEIVLPIDVKKILDREKSKGGKKTNYIIDAIRFYEKSKITDSIDSL